MSEQKVIPEAAVEAAIEAIIAAAYGQELPEAPEDLARAALEAAAPHIKEQALNDAALDTLRRGDVGKDGGIRADIYLMWRARQEKGSAPWGVGR